MKTMYNNQDLIAIHAELDLDHTNQTLRSILAELYEDLGDSNTSFILRWLVKNKMYPTNERYEGVGIANKPWGWWSVGGLSYEHNVVPRNMVYQFNGGKEGWAWSTRKEAEEAFVQLYSSHPELFND